MQFSELGMSKNLADLRFAIKSSSGQESSIWRLWATRHGDVYLATRSMAKMQKYSFHKSGICRSAFTKENGTPRTMTDRAMFKWNRLPTPAAGVGKASRVAWLGFPTDYLSRPCTTNVKGIVWVEAAPAGGATYVEFAFTRESQKSIEAAFQERQERSLLAYIELPSDEAFFGSYYHADWENKDWNVPGNGQVSDLLFSPHDPYETRRPLRICFGPTPSDGDAIVLQELGGYTVPGTPSPAFQRTCGASEL